jgi:hypothetical protein
VPYVASNIAFFDLGQHRTPASIWTARPTSPPSSGLSCSSGFVHVKRTVRCTSRALYEQAATCAAGARGRLGEPMSFWDRQAASLYFPGVYAQGAKALLALGGPERRGLRPARLRRA